MIRCTKCGTVNTADATFCSQCNSYLEWSGEPVAPEAPEAPPATPAPSIPGPPASPSGKAGGPTPGDAAGPQATHTVRVGPPDPGPTAAPPPSVPAAPAAASRVQGPAAPVQGPATPVQDPAGVAGVPQSRKPTAVPAQPPSRRPARVAAVPPPRPPPQPQRIEAPQPGDLVCPNCGTGNDPERRFCRRCGSSLETAPVAPPAARLPWYRRLRGRREAPAYQAGERPGGLGRRRRWRPGWGASIAGLLLLLGVGGSVAYLSVPSVRDLVDDLVRSVSDRARDTTLIYPTAEGPSAAGRPAADSVDRDLTSYWLALPNSAGRWVLSLRFDEPVDLQSINVHAGAPDDAYLRHARPRTIRLQSGSEQAGPFSLRDDEGLQNVPLTLREVRDLRLVVLDVYPGTSGDGTLALRELEFVVLR